MCFPYGIVSSVGALQLYKVGKKMKKILGIAPLALAAASFAADGEYTASTAATELATNMSQLTADVTNTIGPAAIGLVIAVAMVVVGRGFIKKFFKA